MRLFSVLHVENNHFYHAVVKNLLANDIMQYECVKSPTEAMDVLKKTKIDLIITGMIFQDKTGNEFIKLLRSNKYKSIPIIVFSAINDEDDLSDIKQMDEISFVNKNTSLDNLSNCVRKYKNRNTIFEELKKLKIAVFDNNEVDETPVKRIFDANAMTFVHYYYSYELLIENKEKYDLYLLDYSQDNISIEKIVTIIRGNNSRAAIVVIMTSENENIMSNLILHGANDYIKKPFSEDTFLSRIHINVRGLDVN